MSELEGQEYTMEILGMEIADGKTKLVQMDGDLGSAEELLATGQFKNVSIDRGQESQVATFSIKEALKMAKTELDRLLATYEVHATPDNPVDPKLFRKASRRFEFFKEKLRRSTFVIVHLYRW